MKLRLLDHLVCPVCRTKLDIIDPSQKGKEIIAGRLRCREKGCEFPIVKGVPRFVDVDSYADSFSAQRLYVRKHFDHYRGDRSGDETFLQRTGFSRAEVCDGGITLEVGCGYGRYLDVLDRLGGEVIGVDLSTHSVELAYDFVGSKPNVHIVQCDLFAMPFRTKYFNRVFSLGVLHHTPDTRQSFNAIVPYVRDGGRIAIWVYHPDRKRSSDRWRIVTARLPHKVLYRACIANQVLFSWIRRLPGGKRFSQVVPGAAPKLGRPFWLRVMSDFDNLSPKFAHTHTPDEVREWFEKVGLVEIKEGPHSTSVSATMPAETAMPTGTSGTDDYKSRT